MKEYSVYIRQGDSAPYHLQNYKSLMEARKVVNEMVQLEEERHRPYYVDNDFFENKYSHISNLKYICLQVREVSEWSKYSEEKAIQNNLDKILYLSNFKTS